MLTRGQVAKRLGKSISTVRRMEGTSLHPQMTDRGVRLFDESEVEEAAEKVASCGRALPPASVDGLAANSDGPSMFE